VARIVVSRRIPDPGLELLSGEGEVWLNPEDRQLSVDELHARVAGVDALVAMLHDRIDDGLLDAAGPQLQVIANVAVGYDNVDVPAATRHGVLITNTPGVLTDATADLAIALILMITRRLAEGERLVRSRGPWHWNMFMMLGTGVQGKTLGIVGLGEIGQATARRALAFGMEIAYSQRTRAPAQLEAELGGARYLALDELLASADVISLHCPLTPETRHLINAERLALMKRSAYLVNTSRGPVVDEPALATALHEREIAGAALDVFEHEPAVDEGLLDLDNVVLVPHLGSATIETRTAMAVLAARNVCAVLAGEPPPTPVNARELAAQMPAPARAAGHAPPT
jgi:lactate dehydrogenase-like 2-hydroxyacid dehydrogenase